jgi:hypothetical protein
MRLFKTNEGDVLLAGWHIESSYILDPILLYSSGDFDRILEFSAALDTTIVSMPERQ